MTLQFRFVIYSVLSATFLLMNAVAQPSPVMQLEGGQHHMCAVLEDAALYCWGRLDWMGVGNHEGVWTPTRIDALENVAEVRSGFEFLCVRKNDGSVWCVGTGNQGQLGDGNSSNSTTPVQVSGVNNAVRIVTGYAHACALLSDGTVQCWGHARGLEIDTVSNSPVPVKVEGLSNIIDIAAVKGETWGGQSATCALETSGQVFCWGENRDGALGTDDKDNSFVPIASTNLPGAMHIYGGGQHFCVLTETNEIKCWGANYDGQLGEGSRETHLTAVSVQRLSDTTTTLVLGDSFSCALSKTGVVSCWGNNAAAQLGRGYRTVLRSDPGNPLVPEAVVELSGVRVLGAGGKTTCAYNGASYCWGANDYGSLGNGTATTQEFQLTPNPVRW
jgi:alpha-tubulin suppressor-like RCC1 family protein